MTDLIPLILVIFLPVLWALRQLYRIPARDCRRINLKNARKMLYY